MSDKGKESAEPVAKVVYSNWNGMNVETIEGTKSLPEGTLLFTAPPDLLAENKRLRSMLGDAICPHCSNSGAVEGAPKAVCCNRPWPNGECCGDPIPEQTQEQCQWCAERAALMEPPRWMIC